MKEPRYYVEHDMAFFDDQGHPNTDAQRTSWFVVDSAPERPYGLRLAEFLADVPGAETHARAYRDALNGREAS